MKLLVQKFGGTSVADVGRIKKAAKLIKAALVEGNQVIVVVSAMAGVTNQLITLCNEVSLLETAANIAEYDVALCSGEIVTAALLALSLQAEDINARSILAWQLPIITNNNYSNALVESVNNELLKQCLQQGTIPIITGFQGITADGRYTTLGRGGSDTTASLVAASMGASRCDIYTDVEGIFTADPNIIPRAKKLSKISFEEMFELSASGAKILHPRCVEVAMRYNIPIGVRSSFSNNNIIDTLVDSRDIRMEHATIIGVTSNKNLLKLVIYDPKISFAAIYEHLIRNNIFIELMIDIVESKSYNFITRLNDKSKLELLLHSLNVNFVIDVNIATVSIIGFGIKNNNLFICAILEAINKKSIPVSVIQISEIKMLLLVEDLKAEETMRICHTFIE